jgi:hypothetical protein
MGDLHKQQIPATVSKQITNFVIYLYTRSNILHGLDELRKNETLILYVYQLLTKSVSKIILNTGYFVFCPAY